MNIHTSIEPLDRWRLLLGATGCEALGGFTGTDTPDMDRALTWLYGRDPDTAGSSSMERQGGTASSSLKVPEWINELHRLFPRETIERIEHDAVNRYHVEELVTRADVIEHVTPSPALLAAVLRMKHLMNPEVLELARQLVFRVVQELMDKLTRETVSAFSGVIDRRRRQTFTSAANLDLKRTLNHNLKHYDPERQRLYLERLFFFGRTRRHTERWQLILLLDQSGSMVGSVIHAAITAACLWRLPNMRTHLVAFDTSVVDLTQDVEDPVELLMRIQLGGGTDIQQAVAYAADLIETPRRSMVVLISDLFEGSSEAWLIQRVCQLVAQGTRVLCLAALDESANPDFDRVMAARLTEVGARVGAMTPGQLAGYVAEALQS